MPIIPDDMYGDMEMEMESDESTSRKSKTPSALLPKSIVMGKNVEVGDSIIVTVTNIYDDEFEVQYGKQKSSGPPVSMEDVED